MTTETYRDFTIEADARSPTECVFRVLRGEREVFRYTLYITPRALPAENEEEVYAGDPLLVGTHIVRGMLDLGRYQRGRRYREIRAPEWNTRLKESDISDDQVRLEILNALSRLQAAGHEGAFLDIQGVAAVMGVGQGRINYTIASLVRDGLIEAELDESDGLMSHPVLTAAGQAHLDREWPRGARGRAPGEEDE